MKTIQLLLEDDEIMILRAQARMMDLMLPETNDMLESFMKKILDATDDLNPEWKKEIGKMQRAMRKVKTTEQYSVFMDSFNVINKLMAEEMSKEDRI